MRIQVRTCGPDEVGGALNPIWHYFGRTANEADLERMSRVLPAERLHAAVWDGSIVGGAGAYALELTVPGRRVVPTAGVMAVGVLPTHRRRGIMAALMRAQLDAVNDRGEPLALLFASEGAIYRRYGYGVASLAGEIDLPRTHAALRAADGSSAQARLVSHEEALERFPAVYERVAAETPGMFARSRDWWDVRRLTPRPWMGARELARVLVELDGRPEAYAIYSIQPSIERGVSRGVVDVVEAIGASAAGTRQIWTYLLSIDWVERLHATFLPADHPLFLLLVEPRRMQFTLGEALWARLVDVGAALSSRGYTVDGPLVFEIRDDFCSWNKGRWRLESGVAERTDDPADLRLDVADLGSVYLGGFTFSALAAAGRVEELREGAIARGDALFRTDRAPWCPELF
jgi:predicted acetyltransferase